MTQEFSRKRIAGPSSSAGPTWLSRPVEVVFRTEAECRDDPDLEGFVVPKSPGADECESIIANLLDGKAVPQIVVFAKEQGTGALLGISSVRLGGNLEARLDGENPYWLRELSRDPYLALLARDARYPRCILCDGRTRLSTVLVRAAVERATRGAESPPRMWAVCMRSNHPSVKAFATNAFHPDPRAEAGEKYVLTRLAGKRMLPPPGREAYIPAAVERELAA